MTELGAFFLLEPSLFPRRMAGEVWGEAGVSIELAQVHFRVEGLSETQAASLASRYGSRLTRTVDHNAGMTFHVFRAPSSDFRAIDTRGWEYSLDAAWTEESVAMAGMRLMARADFDAARAGLWTDVDTHDEFWGVLENVLRPVLAASLLSAGGLLLHSASADGMLFPSPSGGGKSTISRMALAAGLPVLSDDLNAVVPEGEGWTILPLPFTGDLHEEQLSTDPQRLSAIVALEKGPRDELRKMPLAESVSLLVRCAPYVNQNRHRTLTLLERAAEIASTTSRATLTFQAGGDVWPILNELR